MRPAAHYGARDASHGGEDKKQSDKLVSKAQHRLFVKPWICLTPEFSCKGFHKSARGARTINSSFVSCNACWAAATPNRLDADHPARLMRLIWACSRAAGLWAA